MTVVLLHGLMRTSGSMRRMATALRNDGSDVLNLSYPSMTTSLTHLGEWLERALEKNAAQAPLSFVTHSLGGLVMRAYLSRERHLEALCAVMIAPPNRGSVEADRTSGLWLHSRVLGPVVKDLRTDATPLPAPPCPFGVIAGGTGTAVGYSKRIPGDNDARVRVEETKLEGMTDFLLVHRRHTFIMQAPEVIAATRAFLQTGSFTRTG